jgi:hypothetical protein
MSENHPRRHAKHWQSEERSALFAGPLLGFPKHPPHKIACGGALVDDRRHIPPLLSCCRVVPWRHVTGGVDPRIDGEGCSGDDKGAVEAAGLFTGMAIQSDGLSVVSSV